MKTWAQNIFLSDAPECRLFITYRDDKLQVKTNVPPLNSFDLIDFLVESYKKVALARDEDKHVFEDN